MSSNQTRFTRRSHERLPERIMDAFLEKQKSKGNVAEG